MNIENYISGIKKLLVETFSSIDIWFEKSQRIRGYRPKDGGWTIDEILEHISLTSHFLLILIDKGARKALQLSVKGQPTDFSELTVHQEKLTEIGLHRSFDWIRPTHMEPTGTVPLNEVREQIRKQLQQCLDYLADLKNGEGVFYKTTMSVNGLGKLNVYEYIQFLCYHGARHITQMRENEQECLDNFGNVSA